VWPKLPNTQTRYGMPTWHMTEPFRIFKTLRSTSAPALCGSLPHSHFLSCICCSGAATARHTPADVLTDEVIAGRPSARFLCPSLARDYDFGLAAVKQPASVLNGRKGLDAGRVVPCVDASPRSAPQRLNPWQVHASSAVSEQQRSLKTMLVSVAWFNRINAAVVC
jgi:hypothetical protein